MQGITAALADDIFSGRTTTWGDAYRTCPVCFTSDLSTNNDTIALWMLPEETNIWNTFSAAYLPSPVSSFAQIAPNAGIMRQMLAADITAIGILPSGWLDMSVNALVLPSDETGNLSLPILAATHAEPDDALSQWLTCLQGSLP